MIVQAGSTDVITYFIMRLTADGTEATGLTATDFDLQYTRSGAAAAAKVDATLNGNGVGGAHSGNTVIEVDATSSPGKYRVDWPDAAFAAGVGEVTLAVKVATAFTEHLRVELSPDVNVASVDNDAITAASINTGAFTADAFAADALVAATFATGAFTADAFAADALVAATFATGALTADAFAADALVAATFATGALTADAFAANALVAATFAASSLDGKGDWNTVVPDAAGTAVTLADGAHGGASTVITLQTAIVANATEISGDSTAADNLELQYDGTGYVDDTAPSTQKASDETKSLVESRHGEHTVQGSIFYVDPVNGDTHGNGNRGGPSDPYDSVQDCHDNAITDSAHDLIILVAGDSGVTTLTEDVTLTKRYTFIRGPGRDFIWTRTGSGNTIAITGDGIEIRGCQIQTAATGTGDGVNATGADFVVIRNCWFHDIRGAGIMFANAENCIAEYNHIHGAGQGGSSVGISINASAGNSDNNIIRFNHIEEQTGDGVKVTDAGGGNTVNTTDVHNNVVISSSGIGINIDGANVTLTGVHDNTLGQNTTADITDTGTNTILANNEQWAKAGANNDDLDDIANASGHVTIADGTITAAKFAADALVAATFATGAFTADAFAADAIVAATLATGALTADAFAANALAAATFAASSLDGKGDWNTVVPDAAGVAPTAVENRQEMDSNSTELAKIGTIPALDSAAQTIGAAIGKMADDNAGADFVASTDSLEAIRDRGDAAWTTGAGGSDRLLMVDTTIATLATQISFTLTAGSADDSAYVNCTIVIEDVSTATQKAVGLISAYTGSSKTVTLKYDPGIFTMAATDKVYILAENALKSTAQNRQLDVTAAGEAGLDLDNTSGTLDAAQIGADAITNAKIADDAIAAENFATGALTADAFAANALVAATFAASSLDGKGDWNTVVPDAAGTAAVPGDLMGLAADAITASKYDESTAFPLAIVDSGATQIARTGADSDTLETLSDQIDTIDANAIADQVWEETLADHSSTSGSTAEALAGATAPSAAVVADAVWEEPLADHSGTAGSTAEALSDVSAGASPSTIAAAVWDKLTAAHTVTGSFGAFFSTLIANIWQNSTRTLTRSAKAQDVLASGLTVTIEVERGAYDLVANQIKVDQHTAPKIIFTIFEDGVALDVSSYAFTFAVYDTDGVLSFTIADAGFDDTDEASGITFIRPTTTDLATEFVGTYELKATVGADEELRFEKGNWTTVAGNLA